MNICLCGGGNGFPHLESCPYTCFGNSEQEKEKWKQARDKRRKQIMNPISREALELGREMEWFEIESDDEVTND